MTWGRLGSRRSALLVAALSAAFVLTLFSSVAPAAPGDVFFTDEGMSGQGVVYEVGPSGGPPQPFATSDQLGGATGLAIDPTTGLLVVANFSPVLHTVDPATGTIGVYATGPNASSLGDLVFAPDGRLYVTDSDPSTGAVFRVDPATKAFTQVASGFIPASSSREAAGIAASRAGKLYITDSVDSVYEVDLATGTEHLFARDAQLAGSDGLAFSPDEKSLYVAGFCKPVLDCADSTDSPNQVARIDMATGSVSTLATLSDAVAVTPRTDGSLLVTNTDLNALQIVPLTGSPITDFSTGGAALQYPHDSVIEPDLCAGRIPTIVGTTGVDAITGSPFADVISTLGGKDEVKAGGGNDIVCGGPGKDKLFGQGGKDKLLGQGGKDRLVGGKKKDVDKGGGGADVCVGKGDKLKSC